MAGVLPKSLAAAGIASSTCRRLARLLVALSAAERFQHRDRGQQRAEILQRDLNTCNVSQKAVDVLRVHLSERSVLRPVLE